MKERLLTVVTLLWNVQSQKHPNKNILESNFVTIHFLKETLKGQDSILWIDLVPSFAFQVKKKNLAVFVAHGKSQYLEQVLTFCNITPLWDAPFGMLLHDRDRW